ncbi:hypothetical protein PN419_00080 [Halorubrum ezzemoulense]|uniref:hypothetical protein n=1 Tax=Halorubrum ezzemoulense TaxID=337243 RepID=UPI00232C7D3D|nr:hypothetical protein [Halorubrum ezzemoulense]MDB9247404.1 hypothetical protein [Halorubrum ezzemoulense]MDB9258687.1 hypothetical protein [Halorubrum ezzemoulense]MDB9264455.1 hypothetical protein [Halorubrum ezzemoulense]MDB9269048.1 hypothetical protein [Halorubrum ezzemoulense]MDB9271423.1 hypothetical protein [Halorubrum ezzemoulense]
MSGVDHPQYGLGTTLPHRPPQRSDADTDDERDADADGDGDYECVVCGWATDIPNEHAVRTRHWCDNCDDLQKFKRTT